MPGTVSRLPSGRYRAVLRVGGVTRTPGMSFSTRKEAQLWIAEAMLDQNEPTGPTVAEYATGYVNSLTVRPKTYETYARSLRTIINPAHGLALIMLPQVTSAHVRAWWGRVRTEARDNALRRSQRSTAHTETYLAKAWAVSRGLPVSMNGPCPAHVFHDWVDAGQPNVLDRTGPEPGAASAAQAYRLLRSVFNQAQRDGLLNTNPCQVKGAADPPATIRPILTPQEVDALGEQMPARFRVMPAFAAWTGLRLGEMTALTPTDVDLRTGRVSVRGQHNAPTKTAAGVRQVYLPEHMLEPLRGHIRSHSGHYLFCRENGNRLNSSHISRMFTAAKVRIGRPEVTWHTLRHSAITWALEAGVPVTVVQARSGHADISTTMRYTHHADQAQREAADRLAKYRFR